MNKIFLFFVSIFLFLTGFLVTNADTATLNNPDNNCKFYTELFNILSKSGSASEKLNAKIQMDKYCNLKPSLSPISPKPSTPSDIISNTSQSNSQSSSSISSKPPISSNTSNVTQNTLGNTSISNNVRNCPLVESISCPKGYIRRAVFNEGCLTRYFCQKINQITPSQNPAFFSDNPNSNAGFTFKKPLIKPNCPNKAIVPNCSDGKKPLVIHDQIGCPVSYYCPNEFGKNRCPATALKPYNCPEKNLVPILKNGCIVRYFCNKKFNKLSGNKLGFCLLS